MRLGFAGMRRDIQARPGGLAMVWLVRISPRLSHACTHHRR
jgi:hypothetical protein